MASSPRESADDLLDAPHLTGRLSETGIAILEAKSGGAHNGNGVSKTEALHIVTSNTSSPRHPSSSTEEDAYENYDAQKPELDTIVPGGVGGQLELDPDLAQTQRLWERRKSIPVRLEKMKRKGSYLLTADDPVVKDILIRSAERQRQAAAERDNPKAALRDLVFTRRFTTFDRQNPKNAESPFLGFYVLFWIAMALLSFRIAAQNYRHHGTILGKNELMQLMFKREVVTLGLTDGAMYASTVVGLWTQQLVSKGYIDWYSSGWILQNVWQTFYLAAILGWTYYRDWPWTHTIFIVLHGLVFIMKQHSYAFYNGYLSQVYKRRQVLVRKMEQLERMSPVASPTTSRTMAEQSFDAAPEGLRHRRNKSNPGPANLSSESAEVASVGAAISSGKSLDPIQLRSFTVIINEELEAIDKELKGKCSITDNHYPRNLTFRNWADWSCLPTLVYELEYPRQDKTNWYYVAEKTAATFGVLIIMQIISQTFIYPLVREAMRMKDAGLSLEERWQEFPYLVLDMLFPLLLEQLLTWYVIWECVLNVLAEVMCFADRGFYGNWWSSVSWDQYARDWNRPVHNFLLRHVYNSSISAFHLSKTAATFVTFLLSALVHELLMVCLFKKVRGYLFTMQLLQIPLAMMSRTRFLKNRQTLGNVILWFGLFVGPSFITSLYLIV